jgi:Bacterial Ig-like domain (group 2)
LVGTSTVTAVSSNLSASSQIAVVAPTLESIVILPKGALIPLGETQQLGAVGKYNDGSSQSLTSSVQWSSSSPYVLGLSSSGIATAVSEGTASVTATSGTVKAAAQFEVGPPVVTSLAVAPASLLLFVGGQAQLSATAIFSDSSTQDFTTKVSWSSADPTIAGVNGGRALARRVGETTISASLGALTGLADFAVNPVMAVSYFSNAHSSKIADDTVRLTNPGVIYSNLCAEIYVFDQDQQLGECCGCLLTPDGLLTLSVNRDLTGNPLTGVPSVNGVIKIVPADASGNPSCDATAITPTASLAAWSTNIQAGSTSTLAMTETPFQLTPLGNDELAAIESQCSYAVSLGTGQGVCGCGAGSASPKAAEAMRK